MPRFARLFCSGTLVFATLTGSGCDIKESAAERRIANEDLDLEGEPCERADGEEVTYRLCNGGQGFQTCGGVEPTWGWCNPGDGCTEGDLLHTEYFEEDPCSGLTGTCVSYEGVTQWEFPNCDTPLVLRFDTAPVRFDAFTGGEASAAFSVGDSSCVTTDWPTAATPWLALDLDDDGEIDGGRELFGSGTRLEDGRRATNGFEALAQYDDNGDGRIDAADPVFSRLLLWADHDRDRTSRDDELRPLAESGLQSISVDFHVDVQCDLRGNCGKERAQFVFTDSTQTRVGEVVDVYLPCR